MENKCLVRKGKSRKQTNWVRNIFTSFHLKYQQEGNSTIMFDPMATSNNELQEIVKVVNKERDKRWMGLVKEINHTWKKAT